MKRWLAVPAACLLAQGITGCVFTAEQPAPEIADADVRAAAKKQIGEFIRIFAKIKPEGSHSDAPKVKSPKGEFEYDMGNHLDLEEHMGREFKAFRTLGTPAMMELKEVYASKRWKPDITTGFIFLALYAPGRNHDMKAWDHVFEMLIAMMADREVGIRKTAFAAFEDVFEPPDDRMHAMMDEATTDGKPDWPKMQELLRKWWRSEGRAYIADIIARKPTEGEPTE